VRQGNLTALAQNPAWAALVQEAERKQAKVERLVVAQVLRGRESLTPEAQAFHKGFIAGMRWFIDQPDAAEGALERFLAHHGLTTEEGADAA
jgi:hypothetical protein